MLTMLSLAHAGSYTLSFPERHAQRLTVEAELKADGPTTGLFMATWTPGSYLLREYAQHVERLEATAEGKRLPIRKTAKNRWEVDTDGVRSFTLSYTVYSAAVSVRGNFVDQELAVLNGAPTFIVRDDLQGPYEVRVRRPEDWTQTVSQLPEEDGKLVAKDFDWLIDSPIVVGNPKLTRFEVEGVPHTLVDFPVRPGWDSGKAAAGAKKVAEAQHAFWGSFPYERYLYLNWVADSGGGGLEHLDSTLMLTTQDHTREDEQYHGWLGLVAHEQFHAWNVKRMRPKALGPFDYEHELHTDDLWVAEGFTSYYDDLLLARAGLIDQDDWLERVGKNLQRLSETPGRLEQPVSRASYDAWIELYRHDENSVNTAISYYTKGAVIGWLADARIQEATKGKKSLDDAMRLAYQRYSGEQGYTSEQFREVLSEVAGVDLSEQLHTWVDTATELDTRAALAWFGLKLVPPEKDERGAWLGASLSGDNVQTVLRDSPAWKAGLQAHDELLAIDAHRLGGLDQVLERYQPGATVTLLISRRGQIRELSCTLGTEPVKLELKVDEANKKGIKRLEQLLSAP